MGCPGGIPTHESDRAKAGKLVLRVYGGTGEHIFLIPMEGKTFGRLMCGVGVLSSQQIRRNRKNAVTDGRQNRRTEDGETFFKPPWEEQLSAG